jgi:ribonucleotide monophosphatase NagD (HAD superfamily)
MIIQTIRLSPSEAVWTAEASNVSRLDPSGAVQSITRAIRLIDAGARFIATNPDPTGPSPAGPQPATGAVAALISKATGVRPYFVGKPNPLMMREALRASTPTRSRR